MSTAPQKRGLEFPGEGEPPGEPASAERLGRSLALPNSGPHSRGAVISPVCGDFATTIPPEWLSKCDGSGPWRSCWFQRSSRTGRDRPVRSSAPFPTHPTDRDDVGILRGRSGALPLWRAARWGVGPPPSRPPSAPARRPGAGASRDANSPPRETAEEVRGVDVGPCFSIRKLCVDCPAPTEFGLFQQSPRAGRLRGRGSQLGARGESLPRLPLFPAPVARGLRGRGSAGGASGDSSSPRASSPSL